MTLDIEVAGCVLRLRIDVALAGDGDVTVRIVQLTGCAIVHEARRCGPHVPLCRNDTRGFCRKGFRTCDR
jgi:hypothetical protein